MAICLLSQKQKQKSTNKANTRLTFNIGSYLLILLFVFDQGGIQPRRAPNERSQAKPLQVRMHLYSNLDKSLSTIPCNKNDFYVLFIPFSVFWQRSYNNMKILHNLCLHFARQDGQDRKKRKEKHATKETKIPKTKRQKYGMNRRLNLAFLQSQS